MKKVVKILFVILLVFSAINKKTIKADNLLFDEYEGNTINMKAGLILTTTSQVYTKIEITKGEIDDGVVAGGGATIVISALDGYVIDNIEATINSSFISEYNTIELNENDVIDNIVVYVDHSEDIYNKPVNITVPTFKYGLKLTDINTTVGDDDLKFLGQNLFLYDYDQQIFVPKTVVDVPGTYVLYMKFDSQSKVSYLADKWCIYLNTINVSGAYLTLKYVASDCYLDTGSRSCAYYDHTTNIYLCPLAHFKLNPYTITYDGNGGGVSNVPIDDNKYIYGQPVTISDATPSRDGYIFLGWSKTKDGDVISGTTVEMPNDNLTLYARWQALKITTLTNNKQEEIKEESKVETNTIYQVVNTSTY